jgi:hypothetical protein
MALLKVLFYEQELVKIYDQTMTVLVHYFFLGDVAFGEAELLVLS